jgi:hypothetical protein
MNRLIGRFEWISPYSYDRIETGSYYGMVRCRIKHVRRCMPQPLSYYHEGGAAPAGGLGHVI